MAQGSIIHINGYPGTGKLTIAKDFCKKYSEFRLMDNHMTANPVFTTFRVGPFNPVPDEAWAAIDRIRAIVLDFIEQHSNPALSFIFTNCMYDGYEKEAAYMDRLHDVARNSGRLYMPVVITCDEEENKARVVDVNREKSLKMRNAERLIEIRSQDQLFRHKTEHLFEFDNTEIPAESASLLIYDRLQKVIKEKMSL